MLRYSRIMTMLAGALALAARAPGQMHALDQFEVSIGIDSGELANDAAARRTVYSTLVHVPDASWLRLDLAGTTLGRAPAGGEPTILRIRSLRDGGVQHLRSDHLAQWRHTSAYFNGSTLLVEILADGGAEASRFAAPLAWAGPPAPLTDTICGATDDRLPSEDPRGGRVVPIGCSAWLIDDATGCNLSAGHCAGSSAQVMEFNVPLSDQNGNIQHPPPDDQYAIDTTSVQSTNGGVGNDWMYFGCFANTETGLLPAEAQGDTYVLAASPPPVEGQEIRITGYGTTDPPIPPEWNQAQKTHTGPYTSFSGTTVQYATDTTGGNSGSPVIDESTGEAIGIHTHGGCEVGGGANLGTGSNHPNLRGALAAPAGVCEVPLPLRFEFPEGLPGILDPDGATVRVEVVGQHGGEGQTGTGMLHYDEGGGFVAVPMAEQSANVYDAVFPAFECRTEVRYYFSAETTEGEPVTEPRNAPEDAFAAVAAAELVVHFADDFESETGWTVENEALEDGAWERGVPVGGGVRGDPPADFDGSGQSYLTANRAGNSDVDGGPTRLISPVLDATVSDDPVIAFARWFTNDDLDQDRLDIEISADGGEWELVASIPGGAGWVADEFHVVDQVTATANVRVRFSATDNPNDSVTEAGIDAVRLISYECDGSVPGDVNGDGIVDLQDLIELLAAWGECDEPPAECPADLDGDGFVTTGDLVILLSNWT